MDHDDHSETLSLRAARRKKSSMSLSCCFNSRSAHSFDIIPSPRPTRSSRMSPNSSAGLKGRYKSLISRMGRHRRHSSADFSYDPLSYSLNFEDSDDHHSHHHSFEVEDFAVPSFTSRLPLSPTGPSSSSSSSSANRRSMLMTSSSGSNNNNNNNMPQRAPTTHHQLMGRAAAVAHVRRSLEEEEIESQPGPLNPWKVQEMTRNIPGVAEEEEEEVVRSRLHIPAPRKVKTKMAATAESSRRNTNDLLTPPSRRSFECEEVSPALVVSPTSRHVLVELC